MKFFICHFYPRDVSVGWDILLEVSISWQMNYRWSGSFTDDLKVSNMGMDSIMSGITLL